MWAFIYLTSLTFWLEKKKKTQERPKVSVMKPIKTFHQSLKRGFDIKTVALNCAVYGSLNYSSCVFDIKRALFVYFCYELNIKDITNNKHMSSLWRWSFGRLRLIAFRVLPLWDRCNRLGNMRIVWDNENEAQILQLAIEIYTLFSTGNFTHHQSKSRD